MQVAYALLLDRSDDTVLMVENDPRGWSLPGGGREPGESLAETARRETLEETGHRIEPVKLVAVGERLEPRHDVFFVFAARCLTDEPVCEVDDPEICDVAWMEIARADRLMDWYPRSVVEMAEKFEANYYVNGRDGESEQHDE